MKKNRELEELMSSSLLEIVELPSGEVILRRVDDIAAPLVKIQFSDEAKVFLGEAKADIGRAMIGTGVQMVGQMYEQGALVDQEYETLH